VTAPDRPSLDLLDVAQHFFIKKPLLEKDDDRHALVKSMQMGSMLHLSRRR